MVMSTSLPRAAFPIMLHLFKETVSKYIESVSQMKLQTALEYLTTYSWVLLIAAVSVAALYALGVFNSQSYVSSQCAVPAGFECISYKMNTTGAILVTLMQSTSTPINVTGIACAQNTGQFVFKAPFNPPSNVVYMGIGNIRNFTVQCYNANGTKYSSPVGGSFSGFIGINYTSVSYIKSADIKRTVTGAFVARASSAGVFPTTLTTTSTTSTTSTSTSSSTTSTAGSTSTSTSSTTSTSTSTTSSTSASTTSTTICTTYGSQTTTYLYGPSTQSGPQIGDDGDLNYSSYGYIQSVTVYSSVQMTSGSCNWVLAGIRGPGFAYDSAVDCPTTTQTNSATQTINSNSGDAEVESVAEVSWTYGTSGTEQSTIYAYITYLPNAC